MYELERLRDTIMVLKTMRFGKGFSRTENEAIENSIKYLENLERFYLEITGEEND